MSEKITLAVVTPERIVFEGTVSDAQLPAQDGYMGFLPKHAPLISPLGTGVLTCQAEDGSTLYFSVSGGYFEIHQDRMVVLADIAEVGLDIDLQRAKEARNRAQERLAEEKSTNWDVKRAQAALSRALNRIKVVHLQGDTEVN